MSDAVFCKSVDEYVTMGGQSVIFTALVGEPLADPKIIPRLRYASDAGLFTGLITNGVLLNRLDLPAFLATKPIFLMVSLGPLQREEYERIYRNRNYDNLLAGLKRLLEMRNEIRSALSIHLAFRSHLPGAMVRALPDFRAEIYPLLNDVERSRIQVVTTAFDSWGGQIAPSDLIKGMRLAKPPMLKRRPCSRTFELMVQWDGTVRACSCRFTDKESSGNVDELYVGNLLETSLAAIWNGEAIRRLRRRFVEGQLPVVCRECAQYDPC